MRSALSRIVKDNKAKSFSHWVCLTCEAKEVGRIFRKVIFRMLHNTAARCFQDWLHKTQMNKAIRGMDNTRRSRGDGARADMARAWLQELRIRALKKRTLRVCWRITQKRWNACIARQCLNDWVYLHRINARRRQESVSKASQIWKRRVFAELAGEIYRKKQLDHKAMTVQMNRAARDLLQTTVSWARLSERSSNISNRIERMGCNRRRHLLSRAFCVQRDVIRSKAVLGRKLSKAFDRKLLTRIMVLWSNDAAKDSIVTRRSQSSGGGGFNDSRTSVSGNETSMEFGYQSRSAQGVQAAPHSRRRASVHAYSQFMHSQLRRASVVIEGSFADVALSALGTTNRPSADGMLLGGFPALHESPEKQSSKPALRPSDL